MHAEFRNAKFRDMVEVTVKGQQVKLSNFIQETIFEIALGIHAAKVKSKDIVAVSPGAMDGKSLIEKSYIDFDVSVVVKEASLRKKGRKAGFAGGIEVASFAKVSLSADGSAENETTSEAEQVHRISFKVPIYFNANHRADESMAKEAEIIEKLIGDESPN